MGCRCWRCAIANLRITHGLIPRFWHLPTLFTQLLCLALLDLSHFAYSCTGTLINIEGVTDISLTSEIHVIIVEEAIRTLN
jgi:hypothetical protein